MITPKFLSFKTSLSIQSKIVLVLIAVALSAILAVGLVAYESGSEALKDAQVQNISSTRNARSNDFLGFVRNEERAIGSFSTHPLVVQGMRDFRTAFAKLKESRAPAEWDQAVTAYYRDNYLPKLGKILSATPRIEAFLPGTAEGRYAQFWYIVRNKNDAANRSLLDDAGDGSEYSRVHAGFHPAIRSLLGTFGLDNFLLVDAQSGDVVYTYGKSHIFGTNLRTGVHSDSPVGELFRSLAASKTTNEIRISDYFHASYNFDKTTMMIGTPVIDAGKMIGVVLAEVHLEDVDRMLGSNYDWEHDGLGKTGEAILVGPDFLMRSNSRLLRQDAPAFYSALSAAHYDAAQIERTRQAGTAVLTLRARTPGVEAALGGKSDTEIMPSYLGHSALVSYMPVKFGDKQWALLCEMDEQEALSPLTILARRVLVCALVILLLLTTLAAVIGKEVARPVFRLVEAAHALRSGQHVSAIPIDSNDEFADLAGSFNYMASQTLEMRAVADRRVEERDALIDRVLPAAPAQRLKAGEEGGTDEYDELTVLRATFSTGQEPGGATGAARSLAMIRQAVEAIDAAAESRGVEKLACDGESYLAVCGMSRQRLDQQIRVVDFAQDIVRSLRWMQMDPNMRLTVRIGIAYGPAVAAVIGKTRFSYHLAGDVVEQARWLADHAAPDSVMVSHDIHASVGNLYSFGAAVAPEEIGKLPGWPLLGDTLPGKAEAAAG